MFRLHAVIFSPVAPGPHTAFDARWYIISVKKAARLYEVEGMGGNVEWVEVKG